MIYFDQLCCGIENTILFQSLSSEGIRDYRGLMLPEAGTPARTDVIYVGDGDQTAKLLQTVEPDKAVTVFCAGPFPEMPALPKEANVIVSDLPLLTLHNRLSENLALCTEWRRALSVVPPGEDYPLRLLQCAVSLVGHSFFLIDACFNIVASGQTTDKMHAITRPDTPSRLSPSQINQLFGQMLAGGSPTGVSDIYQISYHMYPICDRGETLGHLLVVGSDTTGRVKGFARLLSERLVDCLRSDSRFFDAQKNEPFLLFIRRMEVYYRQNPGRIIEDMGKLPIPAGPWIRFLIISFENSSTPLSVLLPQVRSIFAKNNITVYDHKIVVLLSFRRSASVDEKACGLEALERLLQLHDGFAILSNACTMKKGIRTEYIQSREVLAMLPKLRLEEDKRCTRLNRYLNYYTIHLCASHMLEEFGHDRLVYFAYPEILNLTRYDVQNNTDLRDVLFYYVMNDCNVARTAQFLHMHRNTVLYKINKIKELVGINLDTGYEKAGILHSCQVLRYMERVQNQQANPLEEAVEYMPKQ